MTTPSEHIEQVNFVNWVEYNYPKIKLFAIPNGGKRSIKTAIDLKSEGVKRGVPDLFIPELFLFIEMFFFENFHSSSSGDAFHISII